MIFNKIQCKYKEEKGWDREEIKERKERHGIKEREEGDKGRILFK